MRYMPHKATSSFFLRDFILQTIQAVHYFDAVVMALENLC